MQKLAVSWAHFRESRDPAALRLLVVLAIVATGLGIFLLAGSNPWEPDIQKRIQAGRELKLEHFITMGLWWGAAAAWISTLVALGTVRWWSRPSSPLFPDPAPATPRQHRLVLWFALAAIALAIYPRAGRLDHSLWNDEEYQFRTYARGDWEVQQDGSVKLDALTWRETLFSNEKGNNHLWSGVEIRLGHWLGGGDDGTARESTFSEAKLRIFPFTSGILTVGMMVLLGAAMGHPRAGLAAGLLLALNPWHVRWSVEIRGYSTMLLSVCTALWCLIRAFQTNAWKYWLGFAASQCLMLLCFAGSVYVVAAFNLTALAVIFFNRQPMPVRVASAARLLAAGIVSFIPAVLLLGPHVPQIAAYLKEANEYSPIGVGWFADLWSHLVTGLRPASDSPGTSLGIALPDLIAAAPWKKWIFFGFLPVLALIGVIRMMVLDWKTRFVAIALLLAGGLAIGHNALQGTPFLTWYVLYLLPLLIFAWVCALTWGRPVGGRHLAAFARSAPLFLAVAYGSWISPALSRITKIPRQPIREAVAAMRGVSPALNQADPAVLTASIGDGARQMLSYDPRIQVIKSKAGLDALMQQAGDSSRPLRLCFRGASAIQLEAPDLLQAVTTDPRWQRQAPVLGMEALLSYEIYHFVPGAIPRIQLNP